MRLTIVFVLLVYCLPSLAFADAPVLPDATRIPSRVTGVVPLCVFFNASTTTDTKTTRPFQDLYFRWNFGDPHSGNWGDKSTGSGGTGTYHSRNVAVGGVAAHCYETPARYTWTLSVSDGSSPSQTRSGSIEVSGWIDGATIGSNTLGKTVCWAASGATPTAAIGGCPANAYGYVNSDFDAGLALQLGGQRACGAGGCRRILLRRGDTFYASAESPIAVPGPGVIGAYGSGEKPIVRATKNSIWIITPSSKYTPTTVNDWRIMDLELTSNDGVVGVEAIHPRGTTRQLTLLNLYIHHVATGIRFNSSMLDCANNPASCNGTLTHTVHDQGTIVDSTVFHLIGARGGYSVYGAAKRFAILGNDMNNDGGGEHTVRITYANLAVISNNTLQGQAATKAALTLRAAVHGSTGVEGLDGADTRYVIVSDNKFIGGVATWTTGYTPQDVADERVTQTVTERNWYTSGSADQAAIQLYAREQTIRNNLFDLSGAAYAIGISIGDAWNLSDNIRVYNNTFYASSNIGHTFEAVRLRNDGGRGTTNITVVNNLAYGSVNDAKHTMISDERRHGDSVTASNNSSDSGTADGVRVNPSFDNVSNPPIGFRPNTRGYGVNGGTDVFPASFRDFFNCDNNKKPTRHKRMGAFEPRSEAQCFGLGGDKVPVTFIGKENDIVRCPPAATQTPPLVATSNSPT